MSQLEGSLGGPLRHLGRLHRHPHVYEMTTVASLLLLLLPWVFPSGNTESRERLGPDNFQARMWITCVHFRYAKT